jgi:hypothetical protein
VLSGVSDGRTVGSQVGVAADPGCGTWVAVAKGSGVAAGRGVFVSNGGTVLVGIMGGLALVANTVTVGLGATVTEVALLAL